MLTSLGEGYGEEQVLDLANCEIADFNSGRVFEAYRSGKDATGVLEINSVFFEVPLSL